MEPDPQLQPLPPPGLAELVADPRQRAPSTIRREEDCRGALTRGLAEYCRQLRFDAPGGRQLQFANVFDAWSAPEEIAEFPVAIVYSVDEGIYDGANMGGGQPFYIPDTQHTLRKVAEFTIELKLEVWCNDEPARRAVSGGLEDALEPVDWMAGFFLALPFYHGALGTYCKLRQVQGDGQGDARRRIRMVTYSLAASIDQLRLKLSVPTMKPKLEIEAEDGADPLTAVSSG